MASTTTASAVRRDGWVSMPSRRWITAAYRIAFVSTLIDAICTYVVVEVYGSASEGNGWLDQLGHAIGWAPAMAVRGVFGLAFLSVLFGLTFIKKRGAALAGRGIIFCAYAFGALAMYQLGGLVYTFHHF